MNKDDALQQMAACRELIDELDRKLVQLLNERTRVVEQLGLIKEKMDMPVYEPRREDEVYRNVVSSNHGPLPPEAMKRLFERIVDEMRTVQNINRRKRQQAAEAKTSESDKGSRKEEAN